MLGAAFHHAVMRARPDHAGCLAMMQDIRRMHLAAGYSDWAYNLSVCHHDRVEVMRGAERVSGANGTKWANLNYWAIVALYDGRYDPLTDGLKAAFVRAARSLPDGTREIHPHSRFIATGCPWDPIRNWIASGIPELGRKDAGPNKDAQPNKGAPAPKGNAGGKASGVRARLGLAPTVARFERKLRRSLLTMPTGEDEIPCATGRAGQRFVARAAIRELHTERTELRAEIEALAEAAAERKLQELADQRRVQP